MKQVWIASDGKQFDTEEECKLHEMMPSYDALNDTLYVSPKDKEDKETWKRLVEDVFFARLDNAEAVK